MHASTAVVSDHHEVRRCSCVYVCSSDGLVLVAERKPQNSTPLANFAPISHRSSNTYCIARGLVGFPRRSLGPSFTTIHTLHTLVIPAPHLLLP